MTGIVNLERLLSSMNPSLEAGEFVFCNLSGALSQYCELNPIASFVEKEGLTLVLPREIAEKENIKFEGLYRQITLNVHSSLEAVGLTAAVATKLASRGISANVIAAYYHDHIFVQALNAEAALTALQQIDK